ncbi:MAG: hypothetical protein AAFR45_03535 [Pseudomonadota bacterium]
MTSYRTTLLKIAAALWVIWGLVHILAGVIVLSSDATGAIQAIADGVDPATLVGDYPAALNGILNQHGWNLLWFGVATLVGAIFIWRGTLTAIWVTALVGGMADIGYFVFVDLPGFVNFVPGTIMTVVSASAILLSFWAWLAPRSATATS